MNRTVYLKMFQNMAQSRLRSLGIAFLLLGMFLFGNVQEASATHLVGSDISYKCTANAGIYEITLVIYRRCNEPGSTSADLCASFACTVPITIRGADPSCNGTVFLSTSLALVSVRDVDVNTALCPTSKNTCTNLGTVAPGTYTPSVERYEFKGLVNLGPSSGIPPTCCNVSIGWTDCCRNSNISSGAADQGFFVDATINRCAPAQTPCNSSPVLSNDPFAIICGNDNYVFNNGAVDPDLDSLTYSFAPALQAAGSSVTYLPPLAYDRPMPWTGQADAPFPDGIHCDPENGDIMFTPPNGGGGLYLGVMTILIKQWKTTDANGNRIDPPLLVGVTRRDIQMVVRGDCLPNNPPTLTTNPPADPGNNPNIPKTNWYICAGDQLCFTVTAKDKDFNPPTVSDTTYLSWNAALATYGATFVPDYIPANRSKPDTLGGGPREDRYKFCWTPGENLASTTPYYFTVTGKDRRCPNPGRVTRAFSIKVIGKADLKVNKIKGKCGLWSFSYTNLKPKFVPNVVQWQISRVPGDLAMVQNPYLFNNVQNIGPIQYHQGGKYYIRIKAITPGPPGAPGCEKNIIDSFDVDSVMIVVKRDTLACRGSETQVTASQKNGFQPFTYRWYNSINDTGTAPLNSNVAKKEFNVTPTATRYYTIEIKDFQGCRAFDSVKVVMKELPTPNLGSDSRICRGDTLVLDPGNNGGNIRKFGAYLWNTGDTLQTISRMDSNQFIVTITDSFNCKQSDTMMLYVNRKVIASLGADKEVCYGDTVILKATGGYLYQWRDLLTNTVVLPEGYSDTLRIIPTNTAQVSRYEVKVLLSYPDSAARNLECSNTDTIEVKVNELPNLNRPLSVQSCMSPTGTVPLSPFSSPNQPGGTGVWSYPQNPTALSGVIVTINGLKNIPPKDTLLSFDNWIQFTYTGPVNKGGCIRKDSANVRIYGNPPTNAGKQLLWCDNAGIYEINTANQGYSPSGGGLRTGEEWDGPGVTTTSANPKKFLFNPLAPGVVKMPAGYNIINYKYTHTYNATNGTADRPSLSCIKEDTTRFYVTKVPVVDISQNIAICQAEPLFDISTKSPGTILPASQTYQPYWEAAAPNTALNGTAITNNGQSFLASSPAIVIANGSNKSTDYKLYYIDKSTGCDARDSITLTVVRTPTIDLIYENGIADSPFVCQNDGDVIFRMLATNVNGPGVSEPSGNIGYYVNGVQNIAIFGSQSPKHAFHSNAATPGSYLLKTIYTVNVVGYTSCSAADSNTIIVQDPPTIQLAVPNDICSYDSIAKVELLQTPNAGYKFKWSVDPTADGMYIDDSSATTNYYPGTNDKLLAKATIRVSTVKNTTLTGNGDQCNPVSVTEILNIRPAPQASIIPLDSEGCVPYLGRFEAGPTGIASPDYTWTWNGVTDPNKAATITKQVEDYESGVQGKYTLTLTVKGVYGTKECSSTSTPALLNTHAVPVAEFVTNPEKTTIAKPFFDFINQSYVADGSDMTYFWNLGPGPDPLKPADRFSTVTNPTNIEYSADTACQPITLDVTTEYGCKASAEHKICIEPDITVFIPNAFRPIGKDGLGGSQLPCDDGMPCNQFFKVVADGQLSVELFIYNRWGQLVFSGKDEKVTREGWNGTVQNNLTDFCPQDVYVYQVNATSYNGKAYKYSGSITLLR
jgi:hypothetical protein